MRYNTNMVEISITRNEEGQRLDRFLRKYLKGAPLSLIYRLIRKDVKVNGKRSRKDYMLSEADVVTLYVDPGKLEELTRTGDLRKARKTFRIAYEDGRLLIADKPAGLLTHGDGKEKSDTLSNQVVGYLTEKGEFDPKSERTFTPSPSNRLDRNTSGLVMFAKDYAGLKEIDRRLRDREVIHKHYLTVVNGRIEEDAVLTGGIVKDEDRNLSRMDGEDRDAKDAVTRISPVRTGSIKGFPGRNEFTLLDVEIESGRTHQIRVQLLEAGHPLIGDRKYGDEELNSWFLGEYGLRGQLLTAYRLLFDPLPDDAEEEQAGKRENDGQGKGEQAGERGADGQGRGEQAEKSSVLANLAGKEIKAKLPKVFDEIIRDLG